MDKMPENRTRKEHLSVIASLAKNDICVSQMYWMKYCPKISFKAFSEAAGASVWRK